jgi:chromosome segregation ATPase
MNNQKTDNLVQMIESLVQEQTFSLDAVEAIKALRDRAESVQQKLEETQQTLQKTRDQVTEVTAKAESLREELNAWKKREAELATRERNIFALEMKAAVAEAKADAYQTSMKITFAPNLVRNAVQSFGGSNQNGIYSPTNETSTRTLVDGYAREGDADANGGAGAQPKNTL